MGDRLLKYKSPNRVLFRTLRILALPLFKLLFRYKRHVDPALKSITGPTLIIGNHTNYIDPVFVALAVPHRRINFVAGSVLMKHRWSRTLMTMVQVIPKLQFVTDTRAVRSMLEIIKQEGTLALFPEARRSLDGASEPFDVATAKLVKKYRMNVITVKTCGAYLSWPRWSKTLFKRGPVESTSNLLLTREDIDRYTANEINNILIRSLESNDFDWQEKRHKPAHYHSSKPALGLERLLHRCPNCQTDLTMRSRNRSIYCSSCDYEVSLGRDMLFHTKEQLYFPSVFDWHSWQRQREAISRFSDGLSWSTPARILELDYGEDPESKVSMLIETGREASGELTISRDLLTFRPIADADPSLSIDIKLTGNGQQVFTNFLYIQMPCNGKLYNIFPEDPLNCIRIVDWVEVSADELHERTE